MRKYHHLGIPTTQPRPGERYLAHLKVHVAGYETSPYRIEWMRFDADAKVPELVRTVPHVAFEVEDLDAELAGKEVIIAPNSPSEGVRVAFIVDNGAPVEFLETAGAPKGKLASISPFFIVEDLQRSIAHYIERFGFKLDFQGPPDDVYYAQVSRDGIGIMLKAITPEVLPHPNHTRHKWARWDAYIYTPDPDTLFDEFKRRGLSFVKELSFIDDGLWGFEVSDADGYVLAFFRTRKAGGGE